MGHIGPRFPSLILRKNMAEHMFMLRLIAGRNMRWLCVSLAALILTTGALGQVPDRVGQKITVINSTQAKGNVDPERLQDCLWLLLQQQGLSEQGVPNIVVFHVSRSQAVAAGVQDNVVRWESINGQPGNSYQVWLID